MKAFWWFSENSIAGMARPGFNSFRWFELPFHEAVVLGWIGQHSSGSHDLAPFRRHLQIYAPMIFHFYDMDLATGQKELEFFQRPENLLQTLEKLKQQTNTLSNFAISDDTLHITLSNSQLLAEVDALKQKEIRHIVSLTEEHHQTEILQEHFELHHISVKDLHAPTVEQVERLARIFKEAREKRERLAVHCLAGIGRTSTMILGAHLLLGENLADLEKQLAKQNPYFLLTGQQKELVQKVAALK